MLRVLMIKVLPLPMQDIRDQILDVLDRLTWYLQDLGE